MTLNTEKNFHLCVIFSKVTVLKYVCQMRPNCYLGAAPNRHYTAFL
jgi:general stress protein CsbA